MFFSIVIPTYNRLPILQKCLKALVNQDLQAEHRYEVVVVDDGSTDGTVEWLLHQRPSVQLYEQAHQGAAAARNLGVKNAKGDTIIFIDSDLVVTDVFLSAHAEALTTAQARLKHGRIFTYGRVINTCNFDDPTTEPYTLTDFSAAYFATGNVAIARHWLEEAGLFDEQFQQYGWEDLELGVRLKKWGLKLVKAPEAVGYHWHPPFALSDIPGLIDQEMQRGRMGLLFYQKHPSWNVRMMIQMTWIHQLLWGGLTIGGRLNEKTLAPVLQWLIDQGKSQLALEVARIFLNWYNLKGLYAAKAQLEESALS
ncbi:MAG: glycosyltransferase family 2 protein [Thermosynechococcaceae cyanobacterium]